MPLYNPAAARMRDESPNEAALYESRVERQPVAVPATRAGRRGRYAKRVEVTPEREPATVDSVDRALTALFAARRKLESELASMPPRSPRRREAIVQLVSRGVSQADVARMLGVTRGRIAQVLAENEEIPF